MHLSRNSYWEEEEEKTTTKKKHQLLHLWLPLAIHFHACITLSGATTVFVVWLCDQL